MTLYIVQQLTDGKLFERVVNAGQSTLPQFDSIGLQQVIEVQADCDELEAVLYNTTNLPQMITSRARVQRWYGDHARYIAGNLDAILKGVRD